MALGESCMPEFKTFKESYLKDQKQQALNCEALRSRLRARSYGLIEVTGNLGMRKSCDDCLSTLSAADIALCPEYTCADCYAAWLMGSEVSLIHRTLLSFLEDSVFAASIREKTAVPNFQPISLLAFISIFQMFDETEETRSNGWDLLSQCMIKMANSPNERPQPVYDLFVRTLLTMSGSSASSRRIPIGTHLAMIAEKVLLLCFGNFGNNSHFRLLQRASRSTTAMRSEHQQIKTGFETHAWQPRVMLILSWLSANQSYVIYSSHQC
jgi:hypothetical protein